jgi:hypothetical protein
MDPARFWSRRRATLAGSLAAAAALLLWPAFLFWQTPLRLAFAASLAVAALCGASILVITLIDMATVRRGRRVRAARAFDLAYGLVLTVPPALLLRELIG